MIVTDVICMALAYGFFCAGRYVIIVRRNPWGALYIALAAVLIILALASWAARYTRAAAHS